MRSKPVMKRLERPSRISVVVISLNEGEQLRRTVENLDDTLPGDAEIIVVDDSSTDGSARRLARRRGRVRVHRVERFGVARAWNDQANSSRERRSAENCGPPILT